MTFDNTFKNLLATPSKMFWQRLQRPFDNAFKDVLTRRSSIDGGGTRGIIPAAKSRSDDILLTVDAIYGQNGRNPTMCAVVEMKSYHHVGARHALPLPVIPVIPVIPTTVRCFPTFGGICNSAGNRRHERHYKCRSTQNNTSITTIK